jgi:tetratricopeptide (TPR) repeat protein
MPQLSKFKFFLIVTGLVIGLAALIGIPAYLSVRKEKKINNDRIEAKRQEMQKNNLPLYEGIVKGVEDLKRQSQEDPTKQQTWIELGTGYQSMGDYINAKAAFKKAIEISDQTLTAWNNLFEIYKDEGDYKNAVKTAKNWIAATKEPTAYLKLAELYVAGKEGNMLDAFDILRKGIEETKSQFLQDAFKRLESAGAL